MKRLAEWPGAPSETIGAEIAAEPECLPMPRNDIVERYADQVREATRAREERDSAVARLQGIESSIALLAAELKKSVSSTNNERFFAVKYDGSVVRVTWSRPDVVEVRVIYPEDEP